MPTAYLIHGYIGAGKTTLAKQLEKRHRAIRFTQDTWMVNLYGTHPPAGEFKNLSTRISMTMEPIWKRCLALGIDVVLDLGFWTRSHRDHVRIIVESSGCESILIDVSCPEEEAKRRVAARNHEENALYISSEIYEISKKRFEPLQVDEISYIVTFPGELRLLRAVTCLGDERQLVH